MHPKEVALSPTVLQMPFFPTVTETSGFSGHGPTREGAPAPHFPDRGRTVRLGWGQRDVSGSEGGEVGAPGGRGRLGLWGSETAELGCAA